jgi:hypothetical protein
MLALPFPAWPQVTCPPAGAVTIPAPNTCLSFFDCFVANGNISSYGIQLHPNSGASTYKGDLNSTYFDAYYSITNANTFASTFGASGPCNVELVIVGTFPNARYFSVSDNDMHYSNAQHLADFTLDPANTSDLTYINPFASSQTYADGNWYLIPVSLGPLPNSTVHRACSINPFEGDNLLDATQRHFSMDWNTVVPDSAIAPENAAPPTHKHLVDNTGHSAATITSGGENMAGDILIRNYLYVPPAPGDTLPTPYVIVRDLTTGCAYNPSWLIDNNWVYAPTTQQSIPDCTQSPQPAGCGAIWSTADLSCPSGSGNCPSPNWLDTSSRSLHTQYTQVTTAGLLCRRKLGEQGRLGTQPGMGGETRPG